MPDRRLWQREDDVRAPDERLWWVEEGFRWAEACVWQEGARVWSVADARGAGGEARESPRVGGRPAQRARHGGR
ncbi:MAG: hypothetical protein COZ57_23905 [Armatimonadetes bacterium CG_4_8_14_3_um_filter_66_20]|nr:MAG: hypothetical protein COZ57_23905 [Armatimonadetes bacterium CG_4_8_14_3_um_filter_66_20]